MEECSRTVDFDENFYHTYTCIMKCGRKIGKFSLKKLVELSGR